MNDFQNCSSLSSAWLWHGNAPRPKCIPYACWFDSYEMWPYHWKQDILQSRPLSVALHIDMPCAFTCRLSSTPERSAVCKLTFAFTCETPNYRWRRIINICFNFLSYIFITFIWNLILLFNYIFLQYLIRYGSPQFLLHT